MDIFQLMNCVPSDDRHHITINELILYYTPDINNNGSYEPFEKKKGIINTVRFVAHVLDIDQQTGNNIMKDGKISRCELKKISRSNIDNRMYETNENGQKKYNAGELILTECGRRLMDEARKIVGH